MKLVMITWSSGRGTDIEIISVGWLSKSLMRRKHLYLITLLYQNELPEKPQLPLKNSESVKIPLMGIKKIEELEVCGEMKAI